MSTLKLGESTSTMEIFPTTSTLEIFPSRPTSTLENEIQKYVQIRDFELYSLVARLFKSSWTWKCR